MTLGGERTMQSTHDVPENYTLESYTILLTTVTPINLIKKENKRKKVGLLDHMVNACLTSQEDLETQFELEGAFESSHLTPRCG